LEIALLQLISRGATLVMPEELLAHEITVLGRAIDLEDVRALEEGAK
jgi:hypothetical protein